MTVEPAYFLVINDKDAYSIRWHLVMTHKPSGASLQESAVQVKSAGVAVYDEIYRHIAVGVGVGACLVAFSVEAGVRVARIMRACVSRS